MAGTKISALPAASALDGTEEVPIVQSGTTKRTTAAAVAALGPSPLPFFGNQSNTPWVRPGLAEFSTWLNQGPASAVDGTGGLPLVIEGLIGTPDYNLVGLFKSIGSPPYAITAAVAAVQVTVGSSQALPIILYNSGAGKAVAFEWNTLGALNYYDYSDVTPGHSASGGAFHKIPSGYFGWFRINNDGVNLTFYYSAEGVVYLQVGQVALSDLSTSTFDMAGFGVEETDMGNNSSSFGIVPLWSWVES